VNLLAAPLTQWLAAQVGLDPGNVFIGPYVPDEPALALIVTLNGGLEPRAEGAIDVPGFQVRMRGEPEDYASAEALARAVDVALMSASMVDIGDTTVLAFSRTGGPPDPDPPDNGDRTTFVCNYLSQVESAF